MSQSKVLNPTDEHYKDICYQKGMQGREQSFLRGPRCVKSFGLRQTFLPQLARRGHFPSRSLTKWQRVHSHPIEKAGELLYIINQCRVLVKLKVPHKIFPCSPCHQYIWLLNGSLPKVSTGGFWNLNEPHKMVLMLPSPPIKKLRPRLYPLIRYLFASGSPKHANLP